MEKKKELQLKDIANYLPHRIGFYLLVNKIPEKNGKDFILEEIHYLDVLNLPTLLNIRKGFINAEDNYEHKFIEAKPILRPLNPNGVSLYEKQYIGGENKYLYKHLNLSKKDAEKLFDTIISVGFSKNINEYFELPHRIIENLFKLHFDIYGLIEKGLAKNIYELDIKRSFEL